MNNKTLLIALAFMIGAIAILGGRAMSASGDNDQISLLTNPNPPGLGTATFIIDVKDKNGKPVDNAAVSFDLNMTTMNMGTQQGEMASGGNGRYSITGRISMRGPWRVRVAAKMPDGSMENKDFIVNVP